MFRPFGSYAGSGEGKGRLERAVFAFLGERGETLGSYEILRFVDNVPPGSA